MKITNESNLHELSDVCSQRLTTIFNHYLADTPALMLKTAMNDSLTNGGKRLRPLLIFATGTIFNAPLENLDIAASSVEIIHTYSLIHDDLPCMDNADLRRGKPTCHKVHGEGIAVLTGDALHTLAMHIIANHSAPLKPERRLEMMKVLTKACGPYGMAAGQAMDITMMNDDFISLDLLENIYRLKTGALFSACIELGWLASNNHDDVNQKALKLFGDNIGLAFQIQDDILDIEAETKLLGKTQGIDAKNNKVTYPKIHGMLQSKQKVQSLYQAALEAINYLGNQAQLLRELASHMLDRQT